MAGGKAPGLKEFSFPVCCGCVLPHEAYQYKNVSYLGGEQKWMELVCAGFIWNLRDLGIIYQEVINNAMQCEVVIFVCFINSFSVFSF